MASERPGNTPVRYCVPGCKADGDHERPDQCQPPQADSEEAVAGVLGEWMEGSVWECRAGHYAEHPCRRLSRDRKALCGHQADLVERYIPASRLEQVRRERDLLQDRWNQMEAYGFVSVKSVFDRIAHDVATESAALREKLAEAEGGRTQAQEWLDKFQRETAELSVCLQSARKLIRWIWVARPELMTVYSSARDWLQANPEEE